VELTLALMAVTAVVVGMVVAPIFRRALWQAQQSRPWPPLPNHGFITGRTAAPSDVDRGDAIFHYGGRSRVLIMPLPQYAIFYPAKGRPLRAVVVQAEMVEDEAQLLGLRLENGKDQVAWRWQVQLLGHTAPHK
jgi:hypothetical protein